MKFLFNMIKNKCPRRCLIREIIKKKKKRTTTTQNPKRRHVTLGASLLDVDYETSLRFAKSRIFYSHSFCIIKISYLPVDKKSDDLI